MAYTSIIPGQSLLFLFLTLAFHIILYAKVSKKFSVQVNIDLIFKNIHSLKSDIQLEVVVGTSIKNKTFGTSLAVQWLRLHLPMQGVPIRSLVRELRSHKSWDQKKHPKYKETEAIL